MLQITPQMKIPVAVEPAVFRRGIDGLVRLFKEAPGQDPFAGTVFVFRNRRGTAIKVLVYDGQGFWLCHKRLPEGRFRWWPSATDQNTSAKALAAHQLAVLFSAGNPDRTAAAPDWRSVGLHHCCQTNSNKMLRCRPAEIRATDVPRTTALDSG